MADVYPSLRYHANGKTRVVTSPDDDAAAKLEGWLRAAELYAVRHAPAPAAEPEPEVIIPSGKKGKKAKRED